MLDDFINHIKRAFDPENREILPGLTKRQSDPLITYLSSFTFNEKLPGIVVHNTIREELISAQRQAVGNELRHIVSKNSINSDIDMNNSTKIILSCIFSMRNSWETFRNIAYGPIYTPFFVDGQYKELGHKMETFLSYHVIPHSCRMLAHCYLIFIHSKISSDCFSSDAFDYLNRIYNSTIVNYDYSVSLKNR